MILRFGLSGEPIGNLHQLLLENGYSLEASELTSQSFGSSTKAAVEDFQNRHVDESGHRLLADGIVGPKTLVSLKAPAGPSSSFIASGWKCEPSSVREAVRGVVSSAVADIGRREQPDGSNSGPEIAKFNPGGQPWCAYAVSTWYAEASGGSPFGRKASAWKIREWALGHNATVVPEQAEPGDLWLAIRSGGHGHVELIVHRFSATELACVGGNVGNAVRGTIRSPQSATIIVRPIPIS